MFYLLKNDQIQAAERFDTAARLVAQGWELTTKAIYIARWQQQDNERLAQIAAHSVPLQERTV